MHTVALESFVAVVEEGSVAGASRRLKITAGAAAQRSASGGWSGISACAW